MIFSVVQCWYSIRLIKCTTELCSDSPCRTVCLTTTQPLTLPRQNDSICDLQALVRERLLDVKRTPDGNRDTPRGPMVT